MDPQRPEGQGFNPNRTEQTKSPELNQASQQMREHLATLFMEDTGLPREWVEQSRPTQSITRSVLNDFEASYQHSLENGNDSQTALSDLSEILGQGTFRGKTIPSRDLPGRYSGIQSILEYRRTLMKIYAVNPEVADFLLENRITGGHGSNSTSIMGATEYGLLPPDEILERGGFIFSGEGLNDYENAAPSGLQDQVVCFTKPHDWRVLLRYSNYQNDISEARIEQALDKLNETIPEGMVYSKPELNAGGENYHQFRVLHQIEHLKKTLDFLRKPDKTADEKQHEDFLRKSFPVVYFISGQLEEGPNPGNYAIPFNSNLSSEYWVQGGTPREMTKLVLVPQAEIENLRRLTQSKGLDWRIEPIEPYQAAFTA